MVTIDVVLPRSSQGKFGITIVTSSGQRGAVVSVVSAINPAHLVAKAVLHVGDQIVRIDGADLIGLRHAAILERLQIPMYATAARWMQ
jgi:C-terminal processing protease CtpA/Prc